MQNTVSASLLCSTGLYISYGGSSILIDVLNGVYSGFKTIPETTARQVIEGRPPFDRVVGLFYSHLHPDHYDPAKNDAFLRNHPDITVFIPTENTSDHGILHAGDFTVEYEYLEHTPCNYTWAKHYVFLIHVAGVSIYLTTDAALDPAAHLAFLRGRQADYGFWNAMYLSYPETRRLMAQAAKKKLIYHMPEPETDRLGFCRKAHRNFQRYPEELRDTILLEHYPAELALYKG